MTTDNKITDKVSKTTLGRKRVEYANLAKLPNMTKKKIESRMLDDSKLFGFATLEEYQAELDKLVKPSSIGKRASDKETRDRLIVDTRTWLAPLNTASAYHAGRIKLTDKEKLAQYDLIAEQTYNFSEELTNAFDRKHALTMIWTPFENNPHNYLNVLVSGWGDGSNTERYQYSPRKIAVFKRSGYRDDSLDIPIVKMKKEKSTKAETSKASKKSKAPKAETTTSDTTINENDVKPDIPTDNIQ